MRRYPCLEMNLSKLRSNALEVISRCRAQGIEVCAVIKGCHGLPEVARLMLACGASQLATSRLEQVEACRAQGIEGPYMLLRVPGMSELSDLIRLCEFSLQSERSVLDALEAECVRQNCTHQAIIMVEQGDLREGIWNRAELLSVCCHVERDLPHVHLAGIGVNLGCYGSIKPTPEKMEELSSLAGQIETEIGRKLDIVSGSATNSFPLVLDGTMPAGINHLRIGEGILLAKDLQLDWGLQNMKFLHMDVFTLHAEVLEVKVKPSYPQGEFAIDAFCSLPVYTDIGLRKRALLGFGRVDVGAVDNLRPLEPGMTVVGASSDHCIVDVTDCRELHPGDIVDFHLSYAHVLYASSRDDMALTVTE